MTVFTINPFDDGYFIDGKPASKFQQFCMRSWERLGCEIKVFDYNSPEVIEAKEKCSKWVDSALKLKGAQAKPIASDAIRLYILSLYPDMLYMDTDVYIADASVMKTVIDEEIFRIRSHNFCIVHNGKRTDIAKKIFDEYYTTDDVKGDKKIIESSEFLSSIKSIPNDSTWLHLPRIESKRKWDNLYVETVDEVRKYLEERPKRHLCFYFKTALKGRLFDAGILPFRKMDKYESPLHEIKYLHNIPNEDFDEFRSFMDN